MGLQLVIYIYIYIYRKMLTDALRTIVNNLFKEIFMEKEKKKKQLIF